MSAVVPMARRPSVADAVAVAELGVKVHPARYNTRARLHSVADWPSSDDPADVAARWPTDRPANIGVALDGLVLVDLDVKHGKNGPTVWDRLRAGRPVPRTWTVRTGTGGTHYLFGLPPGKSYPDRSDLWPGVDIKSGPRSHSLAPGSVVEGRPYVAVDLVPPADAPAWLLAELDAKVGTPAALIAAPPVASVVDRYGQPLAEGERNETLNRFAYALPRDGTPDYAARLLVNEWNNKAPRPLPKSEVDALFSSAAKANTRKHESVSLVRASEIRIESTRWLLADRVPLGAVSVLAGPPGLGKTTYAAWLCARVSRGELPGHLSARPASVVYATFEDDVARTLVPRFAAAGADLGRVYTVRVGDDTGVLTLPRDVEALAERMTEEGARLLVLDPIVAALASTTDAHKDAHVRRALAPLATLATKLDAAVIAVMHLNKGTSTDLLTRVSGSIAFGAAARCVIGVVPDPHDESARLAGIAKSNLGNDRQPARRYVITPTTITTDEGHAVATSRVDWRGESTTTLADALSTVDEYEREEQDDAAAWLDAYLIENGACAPAKDIHKAGKRAGFHPRTLRRAADRLGVSKTKEADRWVWRHPADAPEGDKGTASRNVSPYPPTTDRTDSNDQWPPPPAHHRELRSQQARREHRHPDRSARHARRPARPHGCRAVRGRPGRHADAHPRHSADR